MPKSILMEQHLTPAELHERYKKARDSVDRRKWHALYFVATGFSGADVARKLGMSRSWVSKMVADYNAHGKDWGKAKPKGKAGRKLDITCEEVRLVLGALELTGKRGKERKLNLKTPVKALAVDMEKATGKRRAESTLRRYLTVFGHVFGLTDVVPGSARRRVVTPQQKRAALEVLARCNQASENG